ncbi:MAG: hypothetical protein H0U70_06445 [Tatlockia sp.]|nr:hypothetical protein [Tatlockia sp.]
MKLLTYWSCTKLADWIRGAPTLISGTSEEWRSWEKSAKVKRLRFWLAETGLDSLQNTLFALSIA